MRKEELVSKRKQQYDAPFIAIEGGVCAGKTTTINSISQTTNYHILYEYAQMLDPDHEAKNKILPAEKRLDLFLYLENQRIQLARDMYFPIIGDRCFFSLIAYEFALSRLGSTTNMPKLMYSARRQIMLPNVIVFFDISEDLRRSRWLTRGKDLSSVFVNTNFNNSIRDCFYSLSETTKILFIDADTLTIDDMVRQVLLVLEQELQVKNKNKRCVPANQFVSKIFN